MDRLTSNVGAAAEPVNAPLHGSSGREILDIPETGSSIADRLTMLNLGATSGKEERPTCTSPSQEESSAAPSSMGEAGVPPLSKQRGWGSDATENKQEALSLMEQMMAEAMSAKEEKIEEQRQQQRRDTKKQFGANLKKGFLSGRATTSSVAARKRKTGARTKKENQDASCNTATKGTPQSLAAVESIPVISGKTAPSGGLEFDVSADARASKSGLVFPEVQDAMKSSTGSLGGGGGRGGGIGSMGSEEWLTPELLNAISEKPHLAAMLADPRFAKAVQLMSTSPKDAHAMFASSPKARDSFTELMGLLAGHFTGMGEAADKQAADEKTYRERVTEGPLAQEALKRASEGVGVAASPPTREEAADVERVLQAPELRELLMDPGMQRVLQECSDPATLARYMWHPEYGPKLQLMARAGLVSFKP